MSLRRGPEVTSCAWLEHGRGSDHNGGTGTEDENKLIKDNGPPVIGWELEMPFLSNIDAPRDRGREAAGSEGANGKGPGQDGRETVRPSICQGTGPRGRVDGLVKVALARPLKDSAWQWMATVRMQRRERGPSAEKWKLEDGRCTRKMLAELGELRLEVDRQEVGRRRQKMR